MNRILLLCFLLFYSTTFSQEKENPFYTSQDETYANSQKNENQFATADHGNYDDAKNLINGKGLVMMTAPQRQSIITFRF